MTNYITPHEYESLFHIVLNVARSADGERYVFLNNLADKLGKKGTTALNINIGSESELIESVKEYTRHANNERRVKAGLAALARHREVEA